MFKVKTSQPTNITIREVATEHENGLKKRRGDIYNPYSKELPIKLYPMLMISRNVLHVPFYPFTELVLAYMTIMVNTDGT